MMIARTWTRPLAGPLTCCCLLGASTPALAQALATASGPKADAPVSASFVSPGPAFATLFTDTIDDVRRLPSRDTLTWLGIGAMAATIAHSVDRPVSHGLSTSPTLDGMFEPGETIGGARFQLGGALATYTIGRIMRSPKVALVGADLLQAQIISQVLTGAVKMSLRRTRPDGTQFSFPSGHTSVTFASATVLQRDLGWQVGLPAYGVATYVAASRIQERRHFLSDVAFGAAIGIMAGRTVTVGRGNGRFTLSPMAAPGGGGVSFTWVGHR